MAPALSQGIFTIIQGKEKKSGAKNKIAVETERLLYSPQK